MSRNSLGVLTLDLVVKAGSFTQGMNAAERQANKNLTAIEKRAHKFGQTLGVGLKTAGVAAFGAMAAGLGIYIKNTIEAEKVQAQLASRIKDTGGAAGRTLAQLNAQADKLQGMTIFDDEAIGGVQAMLLTFKQIQGVNFDDATGAVLDLATAMGTDANAAALQLGKALNDPIKGVAALGKAGVQFSTDQKAMIKSLVETGDIAGAQRVILKELEGQMGTAAEAARNTLGGALKALQNSFNNLLEGDSGDAGVKGTRQAIEDLNTTLNDPGVKQGFDTLIQGAVTGVAALARFASTAASVTKFLAEEVAARVHGPALDDIVRIEDRIGRLKTTMDAVKKQGFGNFAIGNASELVPKDFSSTKDAVLKRLQGELDKEQNKLKLGVELSSSSMAAAAKIATDAAMGIKPPTIDTATPSPPGGRTRVSGGKSDAAKQAEDAEKALRAAAEAQAAWHSRILDMSADLEGPTAQVMRDYDKSMEELTGQFNEGKVRLDDYAKAQDLLAEIRDKDLQAIKDQVTPLQEVNAAIAEQMRLVGMSADDQEVWNNLKYAGADADEAQRQQIIESTKALQDYREAMGDEIEAMDAIRDGSKNFLKDLLGGTKSWKDSFLDALDDIQARFLDLIAQNFADQLFGKQGDPAGESSGGWINAILGLFSNSGWGGMSASDFGAAGYAAGGNTKPWSVSEVNERGFEMASVGGKDYLLTGAQSVAITPNHKLGGGRGIVNNNTFHLAAPTDHRTQDQIAQKIAQTQRMAEMRNR